MRNRIIPILVACFVLVGLLAGCTTSFSQVGPTQTPIIIERLVPVEVTREVIKEKIILSTVEITRIVKVSATPQPTNTKEPEEIIDKSAKLSGNYAFSGNNDGQGCHLKVENTLSRIPPKSVSEFPDKFVSRVYFELECSRGAPSYNMGSASGEIIENGNAAVYRYKTPYFEECNLIFIFSDNKVDVYQIGESYTCGFGGNVYANGTYYRVDK